ncbi:MAG: FkbM family methyltransferase [Cyclobacteriaceae bacterium]
MKLPFHFAKNYKRFLFNLSASENPLYLSFYRYFYKPKPGSLSAFLDEYSKKHAPVTFLQIGANDGFIHDPIHKFIKRDHWKGVMLEPQPDVYKEYLIRLHQKRPEITAINAALDIKNGTKTLYKIAISTERWATGLSSFNKAVLIQKIQDGSLQKKALKEGLKIPEREEDWIIGEEIDTISPDALLEKFDKGGFQLLIIDTEGFDFEIIKMLDLNRIDPEVIVYEEANFDEKTVKECQAHIARHGYAYRIIGKDVLATKIKD